MSWSHLAAEIDDEKVRSVMGACNIPPSTQAASTLKEFHLIRTPAGAEPSPIEGGGIFTGLKFLGENALIATLGWGRLATVLLLRRLPK